MTTLTDPLRTLLQTAVLHAYRNTVSGRWMLPMEHDAFESLRAALASSTPDPRPVFIPGGAFCGCGRVEFVCPGPAVARTWAPGAKWPMLHRPDGCRLATDEEIGNVVAPAPVPSSGTLPRPCPACESPEKWGEFGHAPWCAAPASSETRTAPACPRCSHSPHADACQEQIEGGSYHDAFGVHHRKMRCPCLERSAPRPQGDPDHERIPICANCTKFARTSERRGVCQEDQRGRDLGEGCTLFSRRVSGEKTP